jgi:uncharacterized protein DUF6152
MRIRTLSGLVSGLLVAATAGAHHGFGTFDMNADIELTGVITKFDFVNPHSWVHFDVKQPDGSVRKMRCEVRSATTLRRSGWTPDMFAAGQTITIQGSPDRVEPTACYVSTITFGGGLTLDRYGQRIEAKPAEQRAARLANGEPNITGDWAQEQLVMTDPAGRDGTLVPLSQVGNFERGGVPEGQSEIGGARGTPQAAQPRTGPRPGGGGQGGFRPQGPVDLTAAGQAAMEPLQALSRAERSCLQGSIVSDWAGEPVNRITQSGDTIKLEYGKLGLERTIHLNQRTHPASIEPSRAGHSIGWWQNDVLVVDTIGFLPGVLQGITPHSDQFHVVERFTLDASTMALRREYSADDPLFFQEPLVRSDTMMVSTVGYAPEPCEDLSVVAPPAQ